MREYIFMLIAASFGFALGWFAGRGMTLDLTNDDDLKAPGAGSEPAVMDNWDEGDAKWPTTPASEFKPPPWPSDRFGRQHATKSTPDVQGGG